MENGNQNWSIESCGCAFDTEDCVYTMRGGIRSFVYDKDTHTYTAVTDTTVAAAHIIGWRKRHHHFISMCPSSTGQT